MTNYSERRQQQHDARQVQNDQNVRDYMKGAAGIETWSTYGQLGKSNRGGAGINVGSGSGDKLSYAGTPRVSQPFLPGVDRWLEKVPMKVYLALGILGALGGYGHAISTGAEPSSALLDAGAFGFAGLICVHALAKLFKLAVGIAMIAAVGFGIYYFGFAPSH